MPPRPPGSSRASGLAGLAPELRGNIEVSYYEAGHMMYVHRPSLEKPAAELRKFVSA